ncbi:MAG: exo-alpha-sialidase [Planctomycetota bacterium]
MRSARWPLAVLKAAALALAALGSAAVGAAPGEPSSRSRAAEPAGKVPGVVIAHSPGSSGIYIGSPSIAVLPSGAYVASHDEFGPRSTEHSRAVTRVYRSEDRGLSWRRIATIEGQFWSTLFVHRGALYILGTTAHHGNAAIRRSADGGATWTSPAGPSSGLLRSDGEYHSAPVPAIEHAGRLWRAIERRDPPAGWGSNYRAGVLSAPAGADLLDAASWTFAEFLPSDPRWNGGDFGGWLEGNVVAAPDGTLVDVLRVDTRSSEEKAAIARVSADGKSLSFDPESGFVRFPGGAKKFAIRFDAATGIYFALATPALERHRAERPSRIRNCLALLGSPDLRAWTVRTILLYHPEAKAHGFQYPDWLFEGDDIVAVVRTAYDDAEGGARNAHDANYLTFHRFAGFRKLAPEDSALPGL